MGEDEKLRYNPIEKYLKAKQIYDKLTPKLKDSDAIKSIAEWMGETEGEIKKYLDFQMKRKKQVRLHFSAKNTTTG